MEELVKRFANNYNAAYDMLYYGAIPEDVAPLVAAEKVVKEQNRLVAALCKLLNDAIISDREYRAFYLAFTALKNELMEKVDAAAAEVFFTL